MNLTQSLRLSFLLVVPLVGALSSTARATVTQPNGLVVPIVNTDEDNYAVGLAPAGRHVTLPRFFTARGEAIDYSIDAHTTPTVFSPRCNFTGTLVLHGGNCQMDFGWYNVDPNSSTPPTDAQIFTLVPRDANPSFYPLIGDMGATFSGGDIFTDARYTGGLIGFAIKNSIQQTGMWSCPQTHYSEQRLNSSCATATARPLPEHDGGSARARGHCPNTTVGQPALAAGHWVMAVAYQSSKMPNAYYLNFEDLPVTATSYSGPNGPSDGDFNDDVYFITGITCQGGGASCSTGLLGVCASGIQQCTKAGTLTCKQTTQPSGEVCDGLDNDCDGVVDNGNNLCAAGKVCDRGSCVDRCVEQSCPTNSVCTSAGICGEAACQNVTCAGGTRCAGGTCVEPCNGVTCPARRSADTTQGACVELVPRRRVRPGLRLHRRRVPARVRLRAVRRRQDLPGRSPLRRRRVRRQELRERQLLQQRQLRHEVRGRRLSGGPELHRWQLRRPVRGRQLRRHAEVRRRRVRRQVHGRKLRDGASLPGRDLRRRVQRLDVQRG